MPNDAIIQSRLDYSFHRTNNIVIQYVQWNIGMLNDDIACSYLVCYSFECFLVVSCFVEKSEIQKL